MNGTNSIGLPRMCAPPPPNAPVSSLHLFRAFLVLGNSFYSINRVFFCFLNFGVLSTTYISLYTVFAFIIFVMLLSSNDRLDDDDEQSRSVAVALVVVVVVVVVEVVVVVVVTSSGSSRG